MSLRFLALAVALMASINAFALGHGHFFHQKSLQGNTQKLRADGTMRSEEVSFFNQKLDHRNPGSKTFKQRYFVDSQYAADANSPVFYIICGEWNCGGTGSYSFVESLAKTMKAHLVALEHRYYGKSLPTSNLTSNNLKYLDLDSAILDLASFQKFMMEMRNMKGKWVAFGGSYAGTLAAFYRLKYPKLVVGSLASSAPVLMKNEFTEYDAHVAKVINKTSCGDTVREAVRLIEKKLETPEGTKEVKTLFKATNIVNNGDFLYVVADMLAAAVQYGRDKVFCQALQSSSDLVAGYAKGGLTVLGAMGSTPFEISLAVAERVNVTPDDNMRQWMWQSCRQFGWFQVANGNGADTSRSSHIDLAYHEEVCGRLYNIRMGADGHLNPYWYLPLFNPATKNIIFSNGTNDPWLTLSVTDGRANRNFDLFMMEGSAHCNDLTLATNLPSVMNAHVQMERIIGGWLK